MAPHYYITFTVKMSLSIELKQIYLSKSLRIKICLCVFVCEDAVVVKQRHEAMEAARRRMQEELDARASAFIEKQKQVQ